jgi:hypothetical protein
MRKKIKKHYTIFFNIDVYVKLRTMPRQNQKNQAFWLERNQENFGRNPLTLLLICIWVRYDSLTLGAKGFPHFPSFSLENFFKSHLIELEKEIMIQITKMKT